MDRSEVDCLVAFFSQLTNIAEIVIVVVFLFPFLLNENFTIQVQDANPNLQPLKGSKIP